jgi:hypothetical protein
LDDVDSSRSTIAFSIVYLESAIVSTSTDFYPNSFRGFTTYSTSSTDYSSYDGYSIFFSDSATYSVLSLSYAIPDASIIIAFDYPDSYSVSTISYTSSIG